MAEPPTDLHWMEHQVRALYRHDAQGRLIPDARTTGTAAAPPLLFLGRTRHGNLWRLRADLPAPLLRELARLLAAEPIQPVTEEFPSRVATLRERIQAHTPLNAEWHGPAFRFPVLSSEFAGARLVEADRRGALLEAFPNHAEQLSGAGPVCAVSCDDRPVCIAFCATELSATVPAVEVGVETLPGWRGRGFAAQAVSAWAHQVRRVGAEPLYSTSWGNRSSRAVARRLGLICYGADLHFR